MKIGLMSAFNDLYAPLAQIAWPIMEKYCARHGYTPLQGEYHDEPGEANRMSRGDLCKSAMFLHHADNFDALMWLDIDSIIMNHDKKIEDLIIGPPDHRGATAPWKAKEWLWSCNTDGPMSGFWIGRTTPLVRAWVHRFAFACAYEYGGGDQYAMREVAKWPPYDKLVKDCVFGREAGHCFAPEVGCPAGMENTIIYQPGDWLVTFPGLDLARRMDLMLQYAAKVSL